MAEDTVRQIVARLLKAQQEKEAGVGQGFLEPEAESYIGTMPKKTQITPTDKLNALKKEWDKTNARLAKLPLTQTELNKWSRYHSPEEMQEKQAATRNASPQQMMIRRNLLAHKELLKEEAKKVEGYEEHLKRWESRDKMMPSATPTSAGYTDPGEFQSGLTEGDIIEDADNQIGLLAQLAGVRAAQEKKE
jgi:hypothetical protein